VHYHHVIEIDALAGLCGWPTAHKTFAEAEVPAQPIKWVIAGGESGPDARPMHPDWARNLLRECQQAHVPFFMKQMHVDGKLVKEMDQFPGDLRVREFPA
jgi:hypothetical protein